MLEAVSALRNSVAPENLAGSTGFGPFDHGSCEAKILVGILKTPELPFKPGTTSFGYVHLAS